MKRRVLGLDLGAASIGWAFVEELNGSSRIIDLGSRIIPYEGTEGKDFSKGTGESRNAVRTTARTARRGYDRYQLRRKYLVDILKQNDMMPGEDLKKLPKMELWALRAKAVTSPITKAELGRLFLLLNQKRGYKSSRSDANLDKKDTEYVAAVKSRHEKLKEENLTIGQFFYNQLFADEYFRIKENVFPREAYMEEFDAICSQQKALLNDELIEKIRNNIIYYQRPLKSQKGLVAVCEFEGFHRKNKDGKEYFVGPKVAPKSSPLFQLAKIWENVNNIKLSAIDGSKLVLNPEQKLLLFQHLDNNEKLTANELFKILKLNKKDYVVNKQLEKGLQGNITKTTLQKCLGNNYAGLLQLNLNIQEKDKTVYLYDRKTGEVLTEKTVIHIDPLVEKEPLYRLWHTIYSINDIDECTKALQTNFAIDRETALKLTNIDFSRFGFGNKSVKAIRKTLPYLMEGDGYSEAMSYAGYNHSFSLTKEENNARKLLDTLRPVEKNSLRQPIVEKILNQMINVVNEIIKQYGKPDEIRVELARELKQSKEERNKTDKDMSKRQRENETIKKELAEYGLRATRKNIIKWRLYHEIDDHEKKLNAVCIYCGQPISLPQAIKGTEVDVEHIIPKAKLFDDSQSNKTLVHRRCNSSKGDMTAYDFMQGKPDNVFEEYVLRVNNLYENKIISRSKRDKLLMSEESIPQNFIDRQLRETQYISRKAREILQTICCDIWCTSGTVTAELRHLWGWDDVTMNLQLDKYKKLGLTETVDWESGHGKHKHTKEEITGWSKRDDHRHHAIDALTVACTKQGYIQRFNTLNTQKTRAEMTEAVKESLHQYSEKKSLLEKYIISQQPIPVAEVEKAVANILISFKPGKRVSVKGTRKVGRAGKKKVVQTGIIVPRGALSEESVYGKIKIIDKGKSLKYLFENPHLIINPQIKELVHLRLLNNENDVKRALTSLKKTPLYLDLEQEKPLEVADCFRYEYVIKYKVDTNFNKTDKIVDGKVKQILQTRLSKFHGKEKEAFKDVQSGDKTIKWYEDEGLERPILSVRCFTGLSAVVPVRKDDLGNDIGYVKPGNNHHIAIYSDSEGNKFEHVCTFWHAVERKKFGLPVVIQHTDQLWDKVLATADETYPQSFLDQLPPTGCYLELSMQQNEMFVLGLPKEDIQQAIENKDYKIISEYLYRVQKLTSSDYFFRHHLETQLVDDNNAKLSKRFFRIASLKALFEQHPYKVYLNCLGHLVLH